MSPRADNWCTPRETAPGASGPNRPGLRFTGDRLALSFPMTTPRIFLLSPAYCGGERAKLLFNPSADFPLAVRLRAGGVPIGELFAFLSGLYFRGKIAYARAFDRHGTIPAPS